MPRKPGLSKGANATASIMICMIFGGSAYAEQSAVGWGDLAPPQSVIEDPFADLSYEQLDALRKLLRHETSKANPSRGITSDDAVKLRTQLADDGLDVDWLFKQRQIVMQARRDQSTSVNPDVIDTKIRLPGYVLPLEFEGLKVTSFLLVPYAGACIHTPPPPANQMVHVSYQEGIEVSGLFTPVWIEGKITAEYLAQDIGYSDGESRVEVGYQMSAESVYLY